jgi:hypothetical protein
MRDKIISYISNPEYRSALDLPEVVTEEYTMLAQGEYNINYLFTHPSTGQKLVLRINAGSQMHLDRQIEYEAHALRLLSKSGRSASSATIMIGLGMRDRRSFYSVKSDRGDLTLPFHTTVRTVRYTAVQ